MTTILDGHIHINTRDGDRDAFARDVAAVGVSGGVLISLPPPGYAPSFDAPPAPERLDHLIEWAETAGEWYPFFWIDPMEEDACEQAAAAVERGVAGFKIICDRYYPSDPRVLELAGHIARAGKPILFHSGILWNGRPSAKYNRPGEFEALLDVDGLRFAMAHIAWPWCDELIAVYGKFHSALSERPELSVEMFIDTTPGTPPIYRREALTKLFTVGYPVSENVFYGTDGVTGGYPVDIVRKCIDRDNAIYREIGLSPSVMDAVYADNLRRFVGA